VKQNASAAWALAPVSASDFEALLALRLRAMRESLTHLGRYDEERAHVRGWQTVLCQRLRITLR
jgi:hypothetical protein